jgi:hypothetical protein
MTPGHGCDETDALVAIIRQLITKSEDKTTATRLIYAHVREIRTEAANVVRKLSTEINPELEPEIVVPVRKALDYAATKIERLYRSPKS